MTSITDSIAAARIFEIFLCLILTIYMLFYAASSSDSEYIKKLVNDPLFTKIYALEPHLNPTFCAKCD